MFKKIYLSILSLTLLGGFLSANCIDLNFHDADICIDINKEYNNTFEVTTDISNTDGTIALSCYLQLPDGTLENVSNNECNTTFNYDYDDNDYGTIAGYINVNNEWLTFKELYDFYRGERDYNSSYDDNELDDFDIYYVEDETPRENERTTIKIKALNSDNDLIDYDDNVTLTFKRDGDPADDSDIQIRSNDFYYDEYDLDSDGELNVDFNNGYLEFEVLFEYEDKYTITVDDGSQKNSQTFYIGGRDYDTNGDLDDFEIDGDSTPHEDQRETIKINAIDNDNNIIYDYDHTNLMTIEMYDGGERDKVDDNDIDIDISNFNEYYGEDDVYFSNGKLDFEIKFLKDRDYRITIEDEDENIESSKTFRINSSNTDILDNFEFDADFTPNEDEYIDVNIKALNNEDDEITDYDARNLMKIEIYNGYYRTDADENDFTINDISFNEDDGEDDVYFSNGKLDFEIKFLKEEKYKITITDEDENIEDSKEFDVGGTNYGENSFRVIADPDDTDTDERIDLTIYALDDDNRSIYDYDEDITFEIRYKYRTSDTRTRTTSSYYFEINDTDDRDQDYEDGIRFDRDRDGRHTFYNFIKFNKDNYEYKIIVKNKDDTRMYGYDIVNIDAENSSYDDLYRLKITADPDELKTDSRTDIKVEALNKYGNTIRDYDNDIEFTIKYRYSSSSSRRTASSSYYEINDTNDRDQDYEDGIRFDRDRDGRHTFYNFIKFNRNYEYEIIVKDQYDDIEATEIIKVDDYNDDYNSSDIDGFNDEEYDTVKQFYTARNNLIDRLKDQYPKLKYSSYWTDLSDDIYTNMQDVIDDEYDRKYETYDDFLSDIRDRYYETINIR